MKSVSWDKTYRVSKVADDIMNIADEFADEKERVVQKWKYNQLGPGPAVKRLNEITIKYKRRIIKQLTKLLEAAK